MNRIIGVAVSVMLLCVCNQALAVGGYWKPIDGKTYTVKLTDESNHVVVGEFKKTVSWEWDNDGKVTITEWDDQATFSVKDEGGKEQKIDNTAVKNRIIDLQPDMTGKLKGNIKDALK